MENNVKVLDNYLSQTVLECLAKQSAELKTKFFIPRCPGAGISFCNAHDRQRINELLEYFYGEKGESK